MQINFHLSLNSSFSWQVVRVGSGCQGGQRVGGEINYSNSQWQDLTNLENLGGSEHTLDAVLVKIGDPLVHELEQYLEILVVGALQDNDELAIESRVGE